MGEREKTFAILRLIASKNNGHLLTEDSWQHVTLSRSRVVTYRRYSLCSMMAPNRVIKYTPSSWVSCLNVRYVSWLMLLLFVFQSNVSQCKLPSRSNCSMVSWRATSSFWTDIQRRAFSLCLLIHLFNRSLSVLLPFVVLEKRRYANSAAKKDVCNTYLVAST